MDFTGSQWIWAENNTEKNDRVLFRRTFTLEKTPKTAVVRAKARDTLSLYVNGKPIALGVWGCVSYDIAKYLNKGENVIGFDCLYYGMAANGYIAPPSESGLAAACDELQIYSDASFTAFRPYRQEDGDPRPSGKYPGFHSYTDGSRGELGGVFDTAFGSSLFTAAVSYGDAGEEDEPYYANGEYDGTVKVKRMTKTTEGVTNTYVCEVGDEAIFYPVAELTAMGTERVEFTSDRYRTVNESGETETGVRAVYICRNGTQTYASPVPFRGSALIITAPATVSVRTVDLRLVRFPVRRALTADCDPAAETLLSKCDATMRACLDGGILNNTDRDRGTDLFALSVFARSATRMYDDSILRPLHAAIMQAAKTDDGILRNNAGSPFAEERPVAGLLFCSRFGAPAAYRARTGDDALWRELHARLCGYLLTWEFADGALVPRSAPHAADAGYNADGVLIETCLYYSAAEYLCADAPMENEAETRELSRRAEQIAQGFSRYYKEGYFSSGEVCDERANALAVLTGLAGERAACVKDALCSCYNASPAFEGFVIEALGVLGAHKEAYDRLMRRYAGWIRSESPVLPEYFFRAGSGCSSLSVAPVSALVSGVLGIRTDGERIETVLPQWDKETRTEVPLRAGTLRITCKRDAATVENSTGVPVTVRYGNTHVTAEKGKSKVPFVGK